MQREFNSGTNQLPQSTIRSNPYDKNGKLKAGETQADRYGAFEIDSYDLETQTYTVKRPTADSLADAQVMFSVANLAASEVASFGMNGPFWCSLDTSGGTPSVGDDVGTQSGSYKLLKDNTGYKVLAYNATEERVLVRPFSSGGVTGYRSTLSAADNGTPVGTTIGSWTTFKTYTLTAGEQTVLPEIDATDAAMIEADNVARTDFSYTTIGTSCQAQIRVKLIGTIDGVSTGQTLGYLYSAGGVGRIQAGGSGTLNVIVGSRATGTDSPKTPYFGRINFAGTSAKTTSIEYQYYVTAADSFDSWQVWNCNIFIFKGFDNYTSV